MAARESSLLLSIKTSAFMQGIDKMTEKVKASSEKMRKSIDKGIREGTSAGVDGAKESMKSLGSELQGHLKTAATLGGAFALGKFVTDAVQMQSAYRNIAHNVAKVSKESLTWQDIQTAINPIAERTGQTVEDMAVAFDKVFQATGDLEFTKKALESIGTASTASGQEAIAYANVMQIAYRKFGVTADESEQAMAAIEAMVGRGGASLETLGNDFAMLATDANLKGLQGLNKALGLMQSLNAPVGEKAGPAAIAFFQAIKDGSSSLQGLKMSSGIQFKVGTSGFDKVKELLKTSRGRRVAEMTFAADARTVYDTLAMPFKQAYDLARKNGASTSQATKLGLAAYDQAIAKMGQSTGDFTALQDEANKRMKDDPSIVMKAALSKMAVAFQNPKMMSSIERLAQMLPDVADGFVKVLDFVLKHPILSGAGFLGGKMALGAGGSMASHFGGKALGAAGTAIANKFLEAAAEEGAERAIKWGNVFGAAGKTSLLAGSAAVGFMVGKAAAEAMFDRQEELEKGMTSAKLSADNIINNPNASAADKKAALAQVRQQIATNEADNDSIAGKASNWFRQASAAGAAGLGLTSASDGYSDPNADALAKLRRSAADLEASLKKSSDGHGTAGDGASKAADGLDRLNTSIDRLDKRLGNVGGSPQSAPGTKGPPKVGHTGPGYR